MSGCLQSSQTLIAMFSNTYNNILFNKLRILIQKKKKTEKYYNVSYLTVSEHHAFSFNGKEQLWHFDILYERKAYQFGATWGWADDDRFFILKQMICGECAYGADQIYTSKMWFPLQHFRKETCFCNCIFGSCIQNPLGSQIWGGAFEWAWCFWWWEKQQLGLCNVLTLD